MAALIGLALSATCGFRVFVPLLAVCIATRAEKTEGETYVQLAENFSWLQSDPAFVVFLVAAIFEIAGYYLPIIDNFLDTLATPAAVVAGTLITAAFLVDMEPWLQWVLGVIAGGGTAGAVQATTVVARAASTVTTGGLMSGYSRSDKRSKQTMPKATRSMESTLASTGRLIEVSDKIMEGLLY